MLITTTNVTILITTMASALTFQEFAIRIKKAMEALKNITSAEVESVSEIFLRYISLRTTQFQVSLVRLIVVVYQQMLCMCIIYIYYVCVLYILCMCIIYIMYVYYIYYICVLYICVCIIYYILYVAIQRCEGRFDESREIFPQECIGKQAKSCINRSSIHHRWI